MNTSAKDILILCICAIAILFSFQTNSGYSIKKDWFYSLNSQKLYSNKLFPEKWEKLPMPIIADLDGDGDNEILIATDSKLMLMDISTLKENQNLEEQAKRLGIKKEVSFKTPTSSIVGRRPIKMETGYLEPYKKGKIRQRVIVVLTDGFVVLCYNHKLKLIWETTVEHITEEVYFKEVGISISSANLRSNDKGLVVVGSTLSLKKIAEHFADEEELDEYQLMKKAKYLIKTEKEKEKINELIDHFSYHAFDGRTGATRWKHEKNDFLASPLRAALKKSLNKENKNSLFLNSFKNNVEENHKMHVINKMEGFHFGEHDWKVFKEDFLENIPYSWSDRDHTLLYPSHFEKRRRLGAGNQLKERSSSPPSPSSPSLEEEGKMETPHTIEEEREERGKGKKKGNVLVGKNSGGIEVVHLYTGRPLSHLQFPSKSGKILYADVNGDGVIDQIEIEKERERGEYCHMIVKSGFPPINVIFNSSFCENDESIFQLIFSSPSFLDDQLQHSLSSSPNNNDNNENNNNDNNNNDKNNDKNNNDGNDEKEEGNGGEKEKGMKKQLIDTLPPLFFPSNIYATNNYASEDDSQYTPSSFNGQSTSTFSGGNKKRSGGEIIVGVSDGRVMSYSENGEVNWNTKTNSKWNKVSSLFFQSSSPSLSFFPIVSFNSHFFSQSETKELLLLFIGSSHFSILHPKHGTILAQHKLNTIPILIPTIGDWNNDGVNDFIIFTQNSIQGFSFQSTQTTSFLPLLLSSLLCLLVLSLVLSRKKIND